MLKDLNDNRMSSSDQTGALAIQSAEFVQGWQDVMQNAQGSQDSSPNELYQWSTRVNPN